MDVFVFCAGVFRASGFGTTGRRIRQAARAGGGQFISDSDAEPSRVAEQEVNVLQEKGSTTSALMSIGRTDIPGPRMWRWMQDSDALEQFKR
jgi:hypothetical protein